MKDMSNDHQEQTKDFYQTSGDSFFSKKKTLMLLFWVLISATLIGLTIKFVLDINFRTIYELLSNSFHNNKYFWLWLVLLFIFPIYNCFLRIFCYYYKLRKKKIFVRWYEWLNFCFFTIFIGGITPFSMGAEPYIIFWLKKRGLTLKEASAVVLSFTIISPLSQILITWPSFFVICTDYKNNANNVIWLTCFWTVFVGLFFDLVACAFTFLVGYSKRAHYVINVVINRIKKTVRMKYKTNEKIKIEYIQNQEFKKLFLNEMKNIKFVILLSFLSLTYNFIYYFSFNFSFNLLDPNFSVSQFELFNYINVATTANNFIPLPGGEGTLQTVIISFIVQSNGDVEGIKELTNGATYIWRSTTFYITVLIGALVFFYILFNNLKDTIIMKLKTKKSISLKRTFTYIIKNINNDYDLLINSLKSIRWCDYDQKNVQIIVIQDKKDAKISEKKLEEIMWYDSKFVYKSFKSNIEMLKYLKQNRIIETDYISIINSGEQPTYETIKKINSEFVPKDVYMGSYRKMNEKKVSPKKSPYLYLFDKSIKSKRTMSTVKFDLSTIFFRSQIIDNIKASYFNSNHDICFYNLLIQNATILRYENKIYIYKLIKNKEAWDLNTIVCLSENKNPNLAIQVMLLDKNAFSEFKKSHFSFDIKNIKVKYPGFTLFRKLVLRLKYNKIVKPIFKEKNTTKVRG